MGNWKNIAKLIAIVLAGIAFLALTIASNNVERTTDIQNLNISLTDTKLRFVDEMDIRNSLVQSGDSSTQISLQQIDLNSLEKQIETNEFVDNCEAFINNKKQLNLKIQQKQPLFRVLHQSGVSYYVDNSGIKFPKSSKFTANVPVVSGLIVYDVDSLGVQQSKSINDLVKFFRYTAQHEVLNALVTGVNVQQNGDLVMIPRTGKHTVRIGSADRLDQKFERLFIFYKEGLNKMGWDQYDEINLKFKDQIIAKKKL